MFSVFEILALYKTTKNWKHALSKVMPKRFGFVIQPEHTAQSIPNFVSENADDEEILNNSNEVNDDIKTIPDKETVENMELKEDGSDILKNLSKGNQANST